MTCKVFRDTNPASKAGTGKYLYQVAFSQQSRYVYCMVDGSVIVEADKELENVLGKLKNLWVIRQSAPVEVCSIYYLLFGKFESRLAGGFEVVSYVNKALKPKTQLRLF